MANEGHTGLQDLAGVSRVYPPVHNTCLPDLPPEVVAAKRERPKSWLPCEFLTSSCVRKLYNKLSLLLITCPKRFGPFRPLSESYRENGILGALRFEYGLGRVTTSILLCTDSHSFHRRERCYLKLRVQSY